MGEVGVEKRGSVRAYLKQRAFCWKAEWSESRVAEASESDLDSASPQSCHFRQLTGPLFP